MNELHHHYTKHHGKARYYKVWVCCTNNRTSYQATIATNPSNAIRYIDTILATSKREAVSIALRKNTIPIQARIDSIKKRFWDKVIKTESCWEWQGFRNDKGYGTIRIGDKNNKVSLAHRVSYFLSNPEWDINSSDCVLHHCDNRGCVNPGHLWIGTQKDNVADMVAKGRSTKGRKRNV